MGCQMKQHRLHEQCEVLYMKRSNSHVHHAMWHAVTACAVL